MPEIVENLSVVQSTIKNYLRILTSEEAGTMIGEIRSRQYKEDSSSLNNNRESLYYIIRHIIPTENCCFSLKVDKLMK